MAEAVTKSPGPIGEAAFPRCLPTLRETLLDTWLRLTKALRDPYRPELHYMLGPGPKWREKHGSDGNPGISREKIASGRPAESRVTCYRQNVDPMSRTAAISRPSGPDIALNVCGGPGWTSGWHQVRNWEPTR
jgi:hypothetical protein